MPTPIVSPLAPFDVLHVLVLKDGGFCVILTCESICRGGDLECGRDSDKGDDGRAERCGCSAGQRHLTTPKTNIPSAGTLRMHELRPAFTASDHRRPSRATWRSDQSQAVTCGISDIWLNIRVLFPQQPVVLPTIEMISSRTHRLISKIMHITSGWDRRCPRRPCHHHH